MKLKQVSIFLENTIYASKALEISQTFGIPVSESQDSEFMLFIGEKVSLKNNNDRANPIVIDFDSGAVDYRRRFGGGHLLIKAVGGSGLKILDVTAGLARDAFILASHKCQVEALEESPAVAALVIDGIKRGNENPKLKSILKNLDYKFKNSSEFLQTLKPNVFDTVYLDPMFPEKDKAALPKKELRLLQQLLGRVSASEDEARDLLIKSSAKAKRIVVKRPLHGPCLLERPNVVFKGSAVRFDVYLY